MRAQTNNLALNIPPQFQSESRLKIAVIEDEVLFARAIIKRLHKADFICEHVETIADGRALIKQFEPDFVLLDMRLPDGNGLDLLPELAAQNLSVIVMTAHGEVSDAVTAMKAGAVDYLKKPIDLDELLLIVQKNQKNLKAQTSLDYSRQRDSRASEHIALIGESLAMQHVREQIMRIEMLSNLNQAEMPTVLITGETGTGKDVVAHLLHLHSAAADKPFVHVDCASLPAELIESELFGHEKGAFTNAIQAKAGLIEAAEDGTVFLDEVGELPLGLQAKLLQVLERRQVRRIGSTKERDVPARIIAATNRDLLQMVQAGEFRADLYYRLNVINLKLPPLREREKDSVLLAQFFMQQTEKRYRLPRHTLAESAISVISEYAWPGNVRELKHQISRAVLLSSQQQVTSRDLAINLSLSLVMQETETQPISLEASEKKLILNALEMTNFNVSKAARQLNITRMTMRYRMQKHGIIA